MRWRIDWGFALLFSSASLLTLGPACTPEGGSPGPVGAGGAILGQGGGATGGDSVGGAGAGGSANDGDAASVDAGTDVDLGSEVGIEGRSETDAIASTDAERFDATNGSNRDGAIDAARDVVVSADVVAPADVAEDRSADVRSDTASPPDAPGAADVAPWIGKSCVERCNDTSECTPTLPVADFECDLASHRCVVCRNDLACTSIASGWIVGCTTSSDCSFIGDVCVEVNGVGKCAFTTARCAGAFPDDIVVQEFAAARMVTVCGVAGSRCDDGRCVDRCGPLHSCTPEQGGRVCNTGTGGCECADDGDCSGGVGVSKCNTATKRCECSGNADCAGVEDVDVCIDGKCGCSLSNVCKRDFTGTTIACQ